MPKNKIYKPPALVIIAWFFFAYWFASCLFEHTGNLSGALINHNHSSDANRLAVVAGTCCILADIAGIIGLILLAMRRRGAQVAFLGALVAGLLHQFYLFNLDPNFTIYHLVDVVIPVVGIFITLVLIWYVHIATENNWVR